MRRTHRLFAFDERTIEAKGLGTLRAYLLKEAP